MTDDPKAQIKQLATAARDDADGILEFLEQGGWEDVFSLAEEMEDKGLSIQRLAELLFHEKAAAEMAGE